MSLADLLRPFKDLKSIPTREIATTDLVGAVLGAAGLAGLNLIQLGRAYAKDYELLQIKFEAQKVWFLIWGETTSMIHGSSYNTILNHIQDPFSDERKLSRRYRLRLDSSTLVPSGPVVFAETYCQFQSRLSRNQKQATVLMTAKWAIADRKFFFFIGEGFQRFSGITR